MVRQTFKNIVAGVVIGFFVGLVICAYRFLMTLGDKTLNGKIFLFIHESAIYCILWALLLVALALIVHKLIRLEPDAKGGGIPHAVKESEKASDSRWWSVLLAKLIAAPICNFAGFSLGKTGPSIELGAMAAKGVDTIRRKLPSQKADIPVSDYISSGSAAGMAALFNAPLAGVCFALEKMDNRSERIILPAAITATAVSIFFFGWTPIVDSSLPLTDWRLYLCLAVLGVLLGILGWFYAASLSFFTSKLAENKRISERTLWILVFLLAGVVGYFFPQLTGGGTNMLAAMTAAISTDAGGSSVLGTAGRILLLLLLGKYLFSMISSGSGLPGGSVFPLLTVGACVGQLFGIILNALFPTLHMAPAIMLLPGMAGLFSSAFSLPITGIFLLCEFSCNYWNAIPLFVVCFISHIVAGRLGQKK